MNKPQSQSDDCNVICPSCGHAYQAEAEDFDSDERDEDCDKCGQTFRRYDEFTVTHHTSPIEP